MRKINFFITLFFAILLSFSVFATQNNKPLFDMSASTQQLTAIQKKLEKQSNVAALTTHIDQLENLQNLAKTCIATAESHLKSINELLKSYQVDELPAVQQTDYQYLQNKKTFYAKQLSTCRLFVYQSQDVLIDYKDKLKKISARKILQKSTPIWFAHKDIFQFLAKIDAKTIFDESKINDISISQWIVGFLIVLFLSTIAIIIRRLCQQWLVKNKSAEPIIFLLLSTLSKYALPLMVFGTMSAFFTVVFLNISPNPTIELVSYAVFLFVAGCALSHYFLYPAHFEKNVLGLSANIGKLINRRLLTLITWVLIGYFIFVIFETQNFAAGLRDLASTVFITVLSLLTVWSIWPFTKLEHFQEKRHIVHLIKIALIALFIALAIIESFGYHQLTLFIIRGILFTAVLFVITSFAWNITNIIFDYVTHPKYTLAKNIRYFLGVKPYTNITEFSLIRLSIYMSILGVFFVYLMKSWSLSENIIDSFVSGLLDGFKLFEISIIPTRIVVAFIGFSFVLLAGRIIATLIARKKGYEAEKDTQVAFATIFTYLSFAIALLLSLLIIGVDFTGLAIIAGALSVGVGLGLQGIVNNFVSGLILLIEKPIKPGDRVVVDGVEGFVKKVRIRSTQISTMLKEDVIVPNADLIANKVTNYMFRDPHWRATCQVGVKYGSDVKLVEKVLLEVASKHPDVVKDSPNEPTVLFKKFGDSSLVFDLWCIITDVNKKYIVTSQLNFAIDETFRKHNITIAFPQRDVHIKNYVSDKITDQS